MSQRLTVRLEQPLAMPEQPAQPDSDPDPSALTERITVRLTKWEKHQLLALASHAQELNYASVVRKLIQGIKVKEFPPPRPPMSFWDQEAVRALGRIGVNVNQIARELNRHERPFGVEAREFQAIDRALMEVISETFGTEDQAYFLSESGLSEYINQDRILAKKFRHEAHQQEPKPPGTAAGDIPDSPPEKD